jgi:epsilon-lactone hydrolase
MAIIHHDIHSTDETTMSAVRAMLAAAEAPALVPESRAGFDDLIKRTPEPEGVSFAAEVVGGISGWWCRPDDCAARTAILYLHGGAYVLGSAAAYRNLAGQIARRAGAPVFVADYALAPEQPFPAAIRDAKAALGGLKETGFDRLALCGDSAGGGLALALLAKVRGEIAVAGAAAMSPWTDLSLSGESMKTRAEADPLLSDDALRQAVALYLGAADPRDPQASALFSDLKGLPAVRIHVGEDEVLLDDALRYSALAEHAGMSCDVHVWKGMTHVFPASLGMLVAAGEALDDIAAFLRAQLRG